MTSEVLLKDCPACHHPPQMYRARHNDEDKWVIACPECGYNLVGRRVEGFALDGTDIVEVLKEGDDCDRLIDRWNGAAE